MAIPMGWNLPLPSCRKLSSVIPPGLAGWLAESTTQSKFGGKLPSLRGLWRTTHCPIFAEKTIGVPLHREWCRPYAPLLPSSRSNPHADFRTDLGQGFNGQNTSREDRRSPLDSMLSNQDTAPSRSRRIASTPAAQPTLTRSVSNAAWQKWA